jgi:hypothetical protein
VVAEVCSRAPRAATKTRGWKKMAEMYPPYDEYQRRAAGSRDPGCGSRADWPCISATLTEAIQSSKAGWLRTPTRGLFF